MNLHIRTPLLARSFSGHDFPPQGIGRGRCCCLGGVRGLQPLSGMGFGQLGSGAPSGHPSCRDNALFLFHWCNITSVFISSVFLLVSPFASQHDLFFVSGPGRAAARLGPFLLVSRAFVPKTGVRMIGVSRGPSCGASRGVSLAHPSSPNPGSEGSPRVGLARGVIGRSGVALCGTGSWGQGGWATGTRGAAAGCRGRLILQCGVSRHLGVTVSQNLVRFCASSGWWRLTRPRTRRFRPAAFGDPAPV